MAISTNTCQSHKTGRSASGLEWHQYEEPILKWSNLLFSIHFVAAKKRIFLCSTLSIIPEYKNRVLGKTFPSSSLFFSRLDTRRKLWDFPHLKYYSKYLDTIQKGDLRGKIIFLSTVGKDKGFYY